MNKIHLILGPQGAGKSTYAKKLAAEIKGLHLSIDEWMLNLYIKDMPNSINLSWIKERVERCETQIWNLVRQMSKSDCEIILDLGFTKVEKREKFKRLAKEINMPLQFYFLNAPHTIRKERVMQRNKKKGATYSFEVTSGMFDFMEAEFHNPTDQELKDAIIIDTNLTPL